jgi:hypothetical protein
MEEMARGTQIAETKVDFDESGQPVVKSSAKCFPALVHEMIKGVMELMSLHGLKEFNESELATIYDKADNFKDEQWLIQVGAELWRNFLKIVPEDIPLANIYAEFSKQSPQIIHDIVEKSITSPEEAQQAIYEIMGTGTELEANLKKADQIPRGNTLSDKEEKLVGGLADNMPDEDFPKKQIDKGIKVEKEHTNDKEIAKEIAKDHLVETDKYYDYLSELEEKYTKTPNPLKMERDYLSDKEEINAKKKETAPSAKPPKQWWNKMEKEVKEGNPDYTEEQIRKTIGRIWSDLSDKKKSEIREREGKTYKKADNGETTPYYTVTSPSGEKIPVTPGQLAMNDGYVTDSKGNKFKAEEFEARSLEEKVAIKKEAIDVEKLVSKDTPKDLVRSYKVQMARLTEEMQGAKRDNYILDLYNKVKKLHDEIQQTTPEFVESLVESQARKYLMQKNLI